MRLFLKNITLKSLYTTIVLAIVLAGCTSHYLGRKSRRCYYASVKTEQTRNQIRQLRKLDTMVFRNGAGVYIRPIMANNQGTGVYGYNRHSSHFGRVHFFFYKNDSVIPVTRSNEDSLRIAVRQFLLENDFPNRKVNRAMRNLKNAYDILSTDSF
jgi:hypothetical protein